MSMRVHGYSRALAGLTRMSFMLTAVYVESTILRQQIVLYKMLRSGARGAFLVFTELKLKISVKPLADTLYFDF